MKVINSSVGNFLPKKDTAIYRYTPKSYYKKYYRVVYSLLYKEYIKPPLNQSLKTTLSIVRAWLYVTVSLLGRRTYTHQYVTRLNHD